jgi:hypothetical protein
MEGVRVERVEELMVFVGRFLVVVEARELRKSRCLSEPVLGEVQVVE